MIRSLIPPACVLLFASCSVSQDQEVALGRQNPEDSIAKTTRRADLDWHFYVVNTRQVNAFALPGGYVYVNRGLIESAKKLHELTGTLGHEIGHVIQRHSVKQMQQAEKANAGLAVVCTLTSI